MTTGSSRFRLGINYWPSELAMDWWKHFDEQPVKRDFARIRAAGFDSVRIFLLWEDFQPASDRVSKGALKHLVRVADAAHSHELGLIPTLFTGHMSGVNWIPRWAIDSDQPPDPVSSAARFRTVADGQVVSGSPKSWFLDEDVACAQARLARAAAHALEGHPALWAWDLGNENSNCCVPPTREAAVEWLDRVSAGIRAADSRVPITLGLHMEDLTEDRRLGPREAARFCDFLCMHGYPIYADFAESPTDAQILPFLGLITRWLGGCDVLFAEFGAPAFPTESFDSDRAQSSTSTIPLLEAANAAAFTRSAIEKLRAFGFLGAMLWCYAGYAEALWSRPPLDEAAHERWFGLWGSDGLPKPAVEEIHRFQGLPLARQRLDLAWIDMDPEEFYRLPQQHLSRLYRRFCDRLG
ncbi:MAG: beta-galactosidase [Deltaproteobacteria bacterium]|nr:beta-galactosidase [Deltaproteobacteria bacterium]